VVILTRAISPVDRNRGLAPTAASYSAAAMTTTILDLVPEARRGAVRRALEAGLPGQDLVALEPVSGGASGALIYKVTTSDGTACIVRVETASDFFRNPQRIYPSMLAAAEAGVAPPVLHADADEGIAVLRFIETSPLDDHPGGTDGLLEALGRLIARLQSTEPFTAPVDNFGDLISAILDMVIAGDVFGPGLLDGHRASLARIRETYPFARLPQVSAHNDVNPFNILRDAADDRLWLVDWELSFRNDPYADLAIVANNHADTAERVHALLASWRGAEPTADDHARLEVMRQLSRLFYGCIINSAFLGQRTGEQLDARTPTEFQAGVDAGEILAGTAHAMFELGKMNLRAFADGCDTPEFADALERCAALPG
jgi:aminoglycoside phosphotransferase (APT) family kinase protein